MIRHDSLELLLYAASGDCMMATAAEFHAIDASDVTPSPRVLRRLHRLMHRKKPRLFIRVLWSAVLLLLALSLTVYAAVPPVRQTIKRIFVEMNEKYFKIYVGTTPPEEEMTTSPETTPVAPPTHIEQAAHLAYLPAGYELRVVEYQRYQYYAEGYDDEGNLMFDFIQLPINYDSSYDSEGSIQRTVMINDCEGILLSYIDEPAIYMLVWSDYTYKYTIYGFFEDVEELLRIAENVVLP